jgi:hypothetical protein
MKRPRLAWLALLAAAGCSRCAEKPVVPKTDAPRQAGKPAAASSCVGPNEHVASCDDVDVRFPGDPVTVRLCRLKPRDMPGDHPEGAIRAEIRANGKAAACGKLEHVGTMGSICSGPDESECLLRVARDNMAATERFWAPKSSKEHLLVFFGEVLDSDLPSIEIIRVRGGTAQTVFHSEPGRTERSFVFSRLEDVGGDGVPELLGWERQAELEECQPYIPLAIFKLGENGYVRDDALMERWAKRNGKNWLGPEPNDDVQTCEDDEPEPSRAPIVAAPRPSP